MNENNNNEKKQALDLTILKAYLETLYQKIDSRSDFVGMKNSLGLIARELDGTNLNEARAKEILAELILYGRLIREQLEREIREREKTDTPFDKLGKAMTGELQI